MNTPTPTPRTDAEHAQFPMGGFTLDFARQLERELTAVTEQRDRLAEALQGAQAALNPLSGFTKSQHQKHIDVVRDAIRAALEPFRQKP